MTPTPQAPSVRAEALRLADLLEERYGNMVPTKQAAAELRRVHADAIAAYTRAANYASACDELRAQLSCLQAGGGEVVHVCPAKDIVCGDKPANWCATCPRQGYQLSAVERSAMKRALFKSAKVAAPALVPLPADAIDKILKYPDIAEHHPVAGWHILPFGFAGHVIAEFCRINGLAVGRDGGANG